MDGAPGTNLAKIMTKVGNTNNYYFPYRFFDQKCTYTNPWGGNKYIECWVTNDSSEVYHFKVLLPYATFTYYIDDTQGNKCASLINQRATNHRNIVSQSKANAIQSSSTYVANKPLYTTASTKGSSLQTQIADLNGKQTTLKAQIDAATAERDDAQSKYNTASAQALIKLQTSNEIAAKISSLESEKNTIDQTLKDLGTQSTVSASTAQTIKTSVDAALNGWNSDLDALKAAAPERMTEWTNANTELLRLNTAGVNDNFNKVNPKN